MTLTPKKKAAMKEFLGLKKCPCCLKYCRGLYYKLDGVNVCKVCEFLVTRERRHLYRGVTPI